MVEGWACPRCGYVWANWVAGCSNCNQPKTITQSSTTITHYCPSPNTDGSCGCDYYMMNKP